MAFLKYGIPSGLGCLELIDDISLPIHGTTVAPRKTELCTKSKTFGRVHLVSYRKDRFGTLVETYQTLVRSDQYCRKIK